MKLNVVRCGEMKIRKVKVWMIGVGMRCVWGWVVKGGIEEKGMVGEGGYEVEGLVEERVEEGVF